MTISWNQLQTKRENSSSPMWISRVGPKPHSAITPHQKQHFRACCNNGIAEQSLGPTLEIHGVLVICSRFGTHTHTQRQPRCKWIFTFQAQAVEVTYLANVQMLNCSREKSGLLSCHTGLGCVNLKSRRTGRQILW